mmetsp:Transcript_26552/g.65986  ORF Transcript_26552/g.65986 Transcript_26552/m.65986 type:complete len:113 (-) Transcript_26552:531-869(-)
MGDRHSFLVSRCLPCFYLSLPASSVILHLLIYRYVGRLAMQSDGWAGAALIDEVVAARRRPFNTGCIHPVSQMSSACLGGLFLSLYLCTGLVYVCVYVYVCWHSNFALLADG